MAAPNTGASFAHPSGSAAPTQKPKRVRTGCLTCRERHLKCDEGQPVCQNCTKSNRACKRGLRLNFIDMQTHTPARQPTNGDYHVTFLDESREIASEYQGGLARYGASGASQANGHGNAGIQQATHMYQPQQQQLAHQQQQQHHQSRHQSHIDPSLQYQTPGAAPPAPQMSYQGLPPIQGILPDSGYSEDPHALTNSIKFDLPKYENHNDFMRHDSNAQSPFSAQRTASTSHVGYVEQEQDMQRTDEKREYLSNQDEVLFMQVFVEEVGLWMDSMDPMKHFSRLLPFHSLSEPMLLNAFLACGARHLTLINPIYSEEKALFYYDTATRHLLKALQNPNRDTIVCATTAVILNVYEIMSERALQRMNHIAGARALIKECGWNARSQGVGAACFWLNVGLEVLSCLHFNWQVAWDPDDWGVDMDFTREVHSAREELWTHRMLFIVAKVCNFRATIPRYSESDPRDQEMKIQSRYEEWQRLKGWADAWNSGIPRTMHPVGYLQAQQTRSKSNFPEVWLVKRSTIVARLLYHTVMLLLAQINPYLTPQSPEMWSMQKEHSTMVCGIAVHVKDRGVASVALRSLAHAAECLTDHGEQEEVLSTFTRINKETGWRIAFVFKELKERWGWKDDPNAPPQVHITSNTDPKVRMVGKQSSFPSTSPQNMDQQGFALPKQPQQQQQNFSGSHQSSPSSGYAMHTPGAHAQAQVTNGGNPIGVAAQQQQQAQHRRPPSGIVNPMYAGADFNMPQHPYQSVYVAPNANVQHNHQWAQNIANGGLYY